MPEPHHIRTRTLTMGLLLALAALLVPTMAANAAPLTDQDGLSYAADAALQDTSQGMDAPETASSSQETLQLSSTDEAQEVQASPQRSGDVSQESASLSLPSVWTWVAPAALGASLAAVVGLVLARRHTPAEMSIHVQEIAGADPAGSTTARQATGSPGQDTLTFQRVPTEAPHADEQDAPETGRTDPAAQPAGGHLPVATQQELPASELPAGMSGILLLGQKAVDAAEYEEAATWFRTAISLEPETAVAHLCMGLCLVEMDRRDEAIAYFETAAQLDPTDPMPRYQAARTLCRMGETGEAMDRLVPLVIEGSDDVCQAILEDDAFQRLRDHPRFLAILGML